MGCEGRVCYRHGYALDYRESSAGVLDIGGVLRGGFGLGYIVYGSVVMMFISCWVCSVSCSRWNPSKRFENVISLSPNILGHVDENV